MDVVLTASYAMLGRWQEKYDLWDESRAMALLTALGVRELGERLFGSLSEGEKEQEKNRVGARLRRVRGRLDVW